MENVAFTTLVILLFAVPGYVARTVYHTEDFTREVVEKNLSEEIYLAILFSLPFHAIAFFLIDWSYINYRSNTFIDLEGVFGFLSGRYGKDEEGMGGLADNLYAHLGHIAYYFLAMAIIAGITGGLLRDAVWHLKLDVHWPAVFRYRNRWLYTITGRARSTSRDELIPIVDAMCVLGGDKVKFYRGVAVQFTTTTTGDLQALHLAFAFRGKFEDGTDKFFWQEIPGDYFVIKYDTVQNLNITWKPRSKLSAAARPSSEKEQTPALNPPAGPTEEPASSPPPVSDPS